MKLNTEQEQLAVIQKALWEVGKRYAAQPQPAVVVVDATSRLAMRLFDTMDDFEQVVTNDNGLALKLALASETLEDVRKEHKNNPSATIVYLKNDGGVAIGAAYPHPRSA